MNLPFSCCIPDVGCIQMEDEDECLIAGGEDNILACNDPESLCPEFEPETAPEGCYDGIPTWEPDPLRTHHSLDVCERTVAEPTFITEEPLTPYFEPVSSHTSRAQPVGHGQETCLINEGFLTINDEGDAEFLMCTGRAISHLSYASGDLVIPTQPEDDEDEDDILEHAEILFSTEAPFPLEANLFSQGHTCNPPVE